jgi:hypothetical protein
MMATQTSEMEEMVNAEGSEILYSSRSLKIINFFYSRFLWNIK